MCVFEHRELIACCMRTEEVEQCTRESSSISAILPIPPLLTKLIDKQIVTPGKNGTSDHPVPNPSGAEAIVSDH